MPPLRQSSGEAGEITVEQFRVLNSAGVQVYATRLTLADARACVRFHGHPGTTIERRTVTTITTEWEAVDAH